MKLKNSDLEAIVSSQSYRKLFTTEFDDILLVLEIRRQNEDLQPALKAYIETKKALLERHCDKDPATKEPIRGPAGNYSFTQDPSSMQTFQTKFNELLDVEIEIDASKVKIAASALNSVSRWSGSDISIIYPFVEIYEDDKSNDKKGKLTKIK